MRIEKQVYPVGYNEGKMRGISGGINLVISSFSKYLWSAHCALFAGKQKKKAQTVLTELTSECERHIL